MWDEPKKFYGGISAINAYITKQERFILNNPTHPLQKLEKEQTEPKVTRRKKIKIRTERNEQENRKY